MLDKRESTEGGYPINLISWIVWVCCFFLIFGYNKNKTVQTGTALRVTQPCGWLAL